jgi:hypothetical protein
MSIRRVAKLEKPAFNQLANLKLKVKLMFQGTLTRIVSFLLERGLRFRNFEPSSLFLRACSDLDSDCREPAMHLQA